MRALAKVAANGQVTVYIPANSNRVRTTVQRDNLGINRPGYYRASATFDNRWSVTLGARIGSTAKDLLAEAERLEKKAAGVNGTARTGMPGVAGYQQRADAARGAQLVARQTSEDLARIARELAAELEESVVNSSREGVLEALIENAKKSLEAGSLKVAHAYLAEALNIEAKLEAKS